MGRLLVAIALVGAALAFALLDRESGLSAWLGLRHELADRRARIHGLETEVKGLQEQAAALRKDPVAIERAIREDLGLARPGETLVKIPRDDAPTPRIP